MRQTNDQNTKKKKSDDYDNTLPPCFPGTKITFSRRALLTPPLPPLPDYRDFFGKINTLFSYPERKHNQSKLTKSHASYLVQPEPYNIGYPGHVTSSRQLRYMHALITASYYHCGYPCAREIGATGAVRGIRRSRQVSYPNIFVDEPSESLRLPVCRYRTTAATTSPTTAPRCRHNLPVGSTFIRVQERFLTRRYITNDEEHFICQEPPENLEAHTNGDLISLQYPLPIRMNACLLTFLTLFWFM